MIDLYRATDNQGEFDFTRWKEGMREMYPLWMLRYLPNMAACHIGIFHDARGPTNSIVEGDVSALLTIIEAADVVARGHADVMLAGASSTMLSPVDLVWHAGARMSRNNARPTEACRPFDAERDGAVWSEGATMFVLESRTHAQQRGAKPQASILGYGRRCEASSGSKKPTGQAIRQAIDAALAMSHVPASEIGHVNAHGLGTVEDDAIEARAIQLALGEVPVTAPKSFFGNHTAVTRFRNSRTVPSGPARTDRSPVLQGTSSTKSAGCATRGMSATTCATGSAPPALSLATTRRGWPTRRGPRIGYIRIRSSSSTSCPIWKKICKRGNSDSGCRR